VAPMTATVFGATVFWGVGMPVSSINRSAGRRRSDLQAPSARRG
jgi:hypothetical protein